jgi:hypothetical protein
MQIWINNMAQRQNSQRNKLTKLLKRIVAQCRNPARLIELCYWSAEPELAEVMRQYIALPADVRAVLHTFLMLVKDEPDSVNVRIGANGQMILSAPAAVELAGKMADLGAPPPLVH